MQLPLQPVLHKLLALRATLAWLVPLVLILVVQYRLWFDDTGFFANRELSQRITLLEQDNAVHQNTNDALLAEVLALRSGTELLEEKAREELGLIRQGESFILFVDKP